MCTPDETLEALYPIDSEGPRLAGKNAGKTPADIVIVMIK